MTCVSDENVQNKKEAMIKRQHEDVLQVLERQVIMTEVQSVYRCDV